jgi:hypothetical protein
VACSYDVERDELIATIEPQTYLPQERYDRIKTYLRTEPLRYGWNGTCYVLQ